MERAHIANGFYIQGDLKFAIEPNDAPKTFEAVANLSYEDKIKLAQLNEIPAEPYLKTSLTTVLKSVVQNVWLTNKGNVPPLAAHNARLAKYKAELAEASLSSTDDLLSRKRGARISAARPSLKYVIDEAKYEADWKEYRQQTYLVIKTLIDLGAKGTDGKSIRDVLDNCKETRETSAPTRNGVGQIIKKLEVVGIVKCLNPQDGRAKTAKKKAQPTPPAPATTGKKKH